MTAPIDKLLPQLARVRRTAPARWSASCPAHEDRSPSLSVRELDDGTVLIHDFGGCSVEDVVGAVGLTLTDLYPERDLTPGAGRKPERRPFNANDLIRLAAFESLLACIVVNDIVAGKPAADTPRLIEAARRLGNIAEVVNGTR